MNPITINNVTLTIDDFKYSFKSSDFSNSVSNENITLVNNIKILSLPSNGTLYFINEPIEINNIIHITEVTYLRYVRNNNTDISDTLTFSINTTCNSEYSAISTMSITLNAISTEPTNLPLVIEDVNVNLPYQKYPFTINNFLNAVNQNDLNIVDTIIITSLPINGKLTYNNKNIEINNIFKVEELYNIVYESTDLNNLSDTLIFKVNSINNSDYSNTSTMSINVINNESIITTDPITIQNVIVNLPYKKYPFTISNFLQSLNTNDLNIIDKVIITTLPTNGILTYKNKPVEINTVFDYEEVYTIVYTLTNLNLFTDTLQFKVNSILNSIYSNSSIMTINIADEDDIINPSAITIQNVNVSLTSQKSPFTILNFSQAIDDNDLNIAKDVMITSLPANGTLTFKNKPITVNSVFKLQELYTIVYNWTNLNLETDTLGFKVNTLLTDTYSNISTMTISLSAEATKPTPDPLVITNITVTVPTKKYPFTIDNFLQSVDDIDLDIVDTIMITALPTEGNLTYYKQNIALNTVFKKDELYSIVYNWTDFTNNTDSLAFKINSLTNTIYSNMATMTINITDTVNLPPSQVGTGTLSIANSEVYTFTSANFTSETTPIYLDPEGDAPENLRITLLPIEGILTLNDVEIVLNDVITFTDIAAGNLKYVSDISNQTLHTDVFNFDISDLGSSEFTTGGIMNVNVAAYVNQPPTVGDSTLIVDEGTLVIFKESDFLTNPNPDYTDPEGDTAVSVRFPVLPVSGLIKLNGTNITANQEITLIDVGNSLLTYTQAINAGGTVAEFTFQIKDSNGNWSV